MVSAIREFCNPIVKEYEIKHGPFRSEIIEKQAQSVLDYLKSGELSNWDLYDIDIKNFKNLKPDDHQGIGLIIFKKLGEILMICSGGHSVRSYYDKLEQELSDRPGDNARTLFNRLTKEGVKDPNSFIRSCECIVLKPHEKKISSPEIDVIKSILDAFTDIRYKLRGQYNSISMEYWKKRVASNIALDRVSTRR